MTWKSKVFLTALVDSIIAVILLLIGRFMPAEKEFMVAMVAAIQPLALAVIGIIAGDEAGKKVRQIMPSIRFIDVYDDNDDDEVK